MTDSIKESPKRGGVRPSAGRKPQYDEPTAVIRVPVSKKQLVKDFLKTGLVELQGNAVGAVDNVGFGTGSVTASGSVAAVHRI